MRLTSKLAAMAGAARRRWAPEVDPSAGPVRRAAQVGTIISIVVIGVVTLVGILIFSEIQQSLPAATDPALENASDGVVGGFGDAMQLVPIVMLVLVAALVIGVVQRMRMSG